MPRKHLDFSAETLDLLEGLLLSGAGADVTILCGPCRDPVLAHSLFLHTSSRFFQSLAHSEQGQPDGCILKPTIEAPIMKRLLVWWYTHRVELDDECVFELMIAAADCMEDHLRLECQQYIEDATCPENVVTVLKSSFENNLEDLVEHCLRIIDAHFEDAMRSPAVLTLPRDVMLLIVSRETLNVEEDTLWRYCVAWGRYQCGIENPNPDYWAEEEKLALAELMLPLVLKLRIFLISGRVFAEEVEPCGVVPTELLLERYRLGTLPDLAKCGDPRLNPRLGCLSDPDPLLLHFSEEHAHPDLKLRGRSVLCPKDGWKNIRVLEELDDPHGRWELRVRLSDPGEGRWMMLGVVADQGDVSWCEETFFCSQGKSWGVYLGDGRLYRGGDFTHPWLPNFDVRDVTEDCEISLELNRKIGTLTVRLFSANDLSRTVSQNSVVSPDLRAACYFAVALCEEGQNVRLLRCERI